MKRLTYLLFCLVLGIGLATAQTTQVTGVVTEEDGEPIIGAAVVVKGTTTGTVTDYDGAFSLSVPSSAQTLVVSYIGMQTQEVAVAPVVRVVMKSSSQYLDEVIVVAYGTQSSKSVTSSISSVRGDALKDVPSVSFDQMLQGRAAGINVTTPSGAVGQAPVINIRGVASINSGTTPLYVVDGVPINSDNLGRVGAGNTDNTIGSANPLADINPSDILTIDILKDAAATALYGSRAANGVVLITTKRGSQGSAKVSYDMNMGFSNRTKFPEVMNAQQYVEFKNMAYKNVRGNENKDNPFALMYDSKGNPISTNWGDQIFKNGFAQNHTLSVSGGTDKVNYYMSANYSQTEGIVIGDHYDRLGVRANTSIKATKWMTVGMNANYSQSQTSYTDASRNGSTFASSGFSRLALTQVPTLPVYNEDGTPYFERGGAMGFGASSIESTFFNPVAIHDLGNGIDSYINRIIGSVYLDITPIENLVLKTQYGIDNSKVEVKRYWNPYHADGYTYGGQSNAYHQNFDIWTWTNTATYNWNLTDKHHFNFLLGMEASKTDFNFWGLTGSDVNDNQMHGIETDFTTYTGTGDIYQKTMVSYFGRINYDYDYRYMFSANFRRDGYSPLGQNSRWGNFGGASAAWRISEEGFFDGAKSIFDEMKLKVSWGLVGNANVGYYPSRTYYTSNYYGNNGSYQLYTIGDNNLKWESSQTWDVGLTLRLFNRINIDLDYYNTQSSDLILKVPQSSSTGVPDPDNNNTITTNAGKMKNQGFEFTIGSDIIKNKTFNWYSSFNITVNKNKVLELNDDILSSDYSGYEFNNITTEGKSIGQLYLYKTGGIDSETGRRIFYGKNDEKVYFSYPSFTTEDGEAFNPDDLKQEICGNTLPIWYGGWTNNFTYKNFDLTVFFQFSGGNKIYNGTKATMSDMRFWNNSTDVLKNHWSENNKNATYAKPVYGDNYSNGSALSISDWVEKGDYLRLKNISLGYTFDTRKWSSNVGISSLRVYAQAQNLFVITGYSGLDPEVISNTIEPNLTGGIDKNTLPQARTYTFGLNVTF